MSRRTALPTAVLAALLLSGCGEEPPQAPPLAVDSSLVPAKLASNELGVYENTKPSTIEAFANVGPRALISDGRVWEIRRNDRLVATLQISAMKAKVDLTQERVRKMILAPILTGNVQVVRLADVEVNEVTSTGRKDVYVWFGQRLMEVLQVKEAGVASRVLVEELIRHQQTTSAWVPLGSSADLLDEDDE
jgi:hypothetical protein